MISKTVFFSMTVMLLATLQTSTAFSATRGFVDCSSPNLSAEERTSCAGYNPRDFQNKLETVGASLPMNGNRKLMTAKTWPLEDLKIEKFECDLSREGGKYDNCFDVNGGADPPYPCKAGLSCVKFNKWWAQCHTNDALVTREPMAIIQCSGGAAASGASGNGGSDKEKKKETAMEVAGMATSDAGSSENNNGEDGKTPEDPATPDTPADDTITTSQEPTVNTASLEQTGDGAGELKADDAASDTGGDGSAPPTPPAENGGDGTGGSNGGTAVEVPGDDTASAPAAATAAATGGDTPTPSGGDPAACPSEGKWSLSQWGLDEVVGKNFLFFEAQKSGKLPANNRIPWRGDSFMHDEHNGKMLNYGWFDAGDHLKLVFPMAWSIATMAWAVLDGHEWLAGQSFDGNNNKKWAIDTLEYGLEFLLDCSYDNGEFVAQVGNSEMDHASCYRAELDEFTPRKDGSGANKGVFYTLMPESPGADLLFNAAAAYAAGAMALNAAGGSNALADRATNKAIQLFEMAGKSPGIYSDSIAESAKTYPSDNWEQYGFFAAAWLLRLTGDANYETMANQYMESANAKQYHPDYSWGSVYFGAAAVMWQHKVEKGEDGSKFEKKLAYFADQHVNAKGNLFHTPKGLVYVNQWGPLRHAVGDAGILAVYARGLKGGTSSTGIPADAIIAFAEHQITYALGASGHSWIVGFGCNPPVNPHHRDSALKMEESNNWHIFRTREVNANSLIGALVGGPDENDVGNDDRMDYRLNEVALDYNAAFFFGVVQVGVTLAA